MCILPAEEAKRLIKSGSFHVNNLLVESPLERLDPAKHILKGRFTVLRIGMFQTNLHVGVCINILVCHCFNCREESSSPDQMDMTSCCYVCTLLYKVTSYVIVLSLCCMIMIPR